MLVIAELNLEYFGTSIIFCVEANARMMCFCVVPLLFYVTTCFEMGCCVCMMSSEWKHTSVVQCFLLLLCAMLCFLCPASRTDMSHWMSLSAIWSRGLVDSLIFCHSLCVFVSVANWVGEPFAQFRNEQQWICSKMLTASLLWTFPHMIMGRLVRWCNQMSMVVFFQLREAMSSAAWEVKMHLVAKLWHYQ